VRIDAGPGTRLDVGAGKLARERDVPQFERSIDELAVPARPDPFTARRPSPYDREVPALLRDVAPTSAGCADGFA